MHRIYYRIFNLFGIFPFKVFPNNYISFSKCWYYWSLFIACLISVLSIWRSYVYFVWNPEANAGYIYSLLTINEPVFYLSCYILSLIIFLRRKAIKEFRFLFVLLKTFWLSRNMKDFRVKMLILHSLQLCLLWYFVLRTQYTSLSMLDHVDVIFTLIQDTFRLVILLQLSAFSHVILVGLGTVEKAIENKNIGCIYKSLAKRSQCSLNCITHLS